MRISIRNWKVTLGIAASTVFQPFNCASDSDWDNNWDRQDPESLLKWRDRKSIESLEEYASQIEKLKSKAKRHVILIRHGQYETDGKTDSARCLTELGRKQASATGERLKNLNIPYGSLITSTMLRAMETSTFILDSVRIGHKHDEMLEEGFPYIPKPARSVDAHRESECLKHGSRIEAAFRRYFYRANPDQTSDSYDIIVCHANVIRYFVCRALQYPPESWLRMSLPHASITWITIMADGRVSLRCLGDSGHLPPDMITRS